MDQHFEDDLYLLFNMAYDGLEKMELSKPSGDEDVAELEDYLKELDEKPQIAVIQTRNKLYTKSILLRKIVNGKAVLFIFWKRGTVFEGMVASLDGNSVLNEFIWLQDAQTGKYKATLKPKSTGSMKADRQAMMVRAAISSVLIEPLNSSRYKEKFGGDILKKLSVERFDVLKDLKKRGLIPEDAEDPVQARMAAAAANKKQPKKVKTHDEFRAIQKDGKMTFTKKSVDDESAAERLAKDLAREERLANREEELALKKALEAL